jgi:hypothetical protein
MLANKAIRRELDFTYLGSNVSENGGTRKDVETRIQKARGAFTRLRKIWMSHLNEDNKVKLLDVYVKSVILYYTIPCWSHLKFRESFRPL